MPARLVALVFVALVPATVLVVLQAFENRSAEEEAVGEEVERLADVVALQQNNFVTSTASLVQVLARTDEVRAAGRACERFVRDIHGDNPHLTAVGVVGLDGAQRCLSIDSPTPINLADRGYFQRAVAGGGPGMGDYRIGKVSGVPTLGVAHAIGGEDGASQGVVFATIDLRRPLHVGPDLDLPAGSSISVVDRDAKVLARWPEDPDAIGQEFPELLDTTRLVGEAFIRRGIDGRERIYGAAPLVQGARRDLLLGVAIPLDEAHAEPNARLAATLRWFAAIGLLTAAAAFAVGHLTMVRPLRRLASVAARIASGDLAARAGDLGGSEIGDLGVRLNSMAESLQRRELDLAAAERRAVEERYEGLLDVAADAVVLVDPAGRIQLFGRGAEALFGVAAGEAVGRSLVTLAASQTALDEERAEIEWIGAGGRHFFADTTTSVGSDGLTTVILRDVTARRAAERRFRRLVEAAPDAMVIIGADERIQIANERVRDVFGFEPGELVGERIEVLLAEQQPDEHNRPHSGDASTPLAGQIRGGRELTGRRKDKSEFPMELSLAPIDTDEGTVTSAAIRDITERRAAEQHLAEQADALSRSNAELEQFAYVASHDLSEPLRVVSGFVQLLSRRYQGQLDDRADEYIGFAVDGCARMQRLIHDLLAYSRVGRVDVDMGDVDTHATAVRALGALESAIEESGAVVEIAPLPLITGNEGLLAPLFQNLLDNAIKFCKKGRTPRVRVAATRDGSSWRFTVADNGIGIAPEHRERVFQMFQRLHGRDEFPGTGIGLALCRKIVEFHGGDLSVEETPGGGSTFAFTIPDRKESS